MAARAGTDVAFDQLAGAAHLDAAERSNGLEDDEHAPWVCRQVAGSLRSPLAITTSNPPSCQRNHTGETSALPSFRYVVNTAGEGASRSDRTSSADPGLPHMLSTTISELASWSRKKNSSGTVPSPPIVSASTSTPFALQLLVNGAGVRGLERDARHAARLVLAA